jgi:hypothetical protein
LTVILKNPSTAGAARSDPTVGKVEAWARGHGFGVVTYVNLFALRSPYPGALNGVSYEDAVGLHNDMTLARALAEPGTVVAAWGNPNGIDPARYRRRVDEVWALLAAHLSTPLYTVGPLTQQGYPRHGLQWRVGMELQDRYLHFFASSAPFASLR